METNDNEFCTPGLGRKRRGRCSALDDFLLNRLSKLQQRETQQSSEQHNDTHGSQSNTGTALGTIHTSLSLNRTSQPIPSDVVNNESQSTTRTALGTIDTNVKLRTTGESNSTCVLEVADSRIGSISFSKDLHGSKDKESKKRGRGPGVNKMFNDLQKENQPPKENPQVSKRRGRGLGVKTLAKQRLAQESQITPKEGTSGIAGLVTPSSTITFQNTPGFCQPSCNGRFSSHTNQNTEGSARSYVTVSAKPQQISAYEMQRPFRPHQGASTSGIKNLLHEFDDATDSTVFDEDMFTHGNLC
ncbi:hypothetical protein ACET3Z_018097 [Daucus carota]